MKVYLAKDWRGCHVYNEPPALLKNLPSFPPTWSGHELKEFNMTDSFAEDEIPKGQYIERHIYWAMVQKSNIQ